MAKIKRIVTSEVEGRNVSDFYGDNSYSIQTNGQINYYGPGGMGPVIAPGIVYGANADSGDGYGYNTLKLVPNSSDGDIYDHRYLIIDPTAPNHIHIRAGGQPDESNAELFLGAEKTYVKVNNDGREVRVSSRRQQQVMAHANGNVDSGDYLTTTDQVIAVPGWTVEVNGVMHYIQNVTVGDGTTTIYAPGANFALNGVYNFFSPEGVNEWTFDSDGNLYGPGDGSRLAVTGIEAGEGVNNLSIFSRNSMTLTANGGDMNLYMDGGLYIGASASENQILKQSDVSNVSRVVPVPANATDTGATGQIAVDSSYLYVCVATNTWKRVALSTW